jgi:hypothetical protein
MPRNIGSVDRFIRFVVGVLALGLYGALEPPGRYFTLLGLIPLGTALTGNCPVYSLMGISTRGKSAGSPS